MQIGIDLSPREICGVLLCKSVILATVTTPVYFAAGESKKNIMDKIVEIIDGLFTSKVKSIGVSLPTKIDPEKGTIYDLSKIPHWKNIRLKTIIEDRFHVPTFINGDIHCFVWGEKSYGACKEYKDIICITIDPSISTGVVVNNKLYSNLQASFSQAQCLSKANLKCVKEYHHSFMSTVEELLLLTTAYSKELEWPNHNFWKSIGPVVGRLATIMLCSFDSEVIVLGGELSYSFDFCSDGIKDYIETYKPSHIKTRKKIIPSEIRNAKAIGAAYLSAS